MLVLMMGPYAATRVLSAVSRRDFDLRRAAAFGLSLLFLFTGVGHFIQTEPMAQMLPAWVLRGPSSSMRPAFLEFIFVAGFIMPRTRGLAGWVAAAGLVLFLPANIYAAFNHVPMGGHVEGPVYLLVRAPLQFIILFWVYWFTIRPRASILSVNSQVQE